MVKILIDHIANACSSMEYLARQRQNEIDAVDDVMRSLESLSGMQDVTSKLRRTTEELREEQRGLLDLVQALIRIRETYLRADRKVADNGEGNLRRVHYPTTTYMNIFSNPDVLIKNTKKK